MIILRHFIIDYNDLPHIRLRTVSAYPSNVNVTTPADVSLNDDIGDFRSLQTIFTSTDLGNLRTKFYMDWTTRNDYD